MGIVVVNIRARANNKNRGMFVNRPMKKIKKLTPNKYISQFFIDELYFMVKFQVIYWKTLPTNPTEQVAVPMFGPTIRAVKIE